MQNDIPIITHRLKSKPEVQFQYGGRPFSETGIGFSRGVRYLIKIWQANGYPHSLTTAITKPEPGSRFPIL